MSEPTVRAHVFEQFEPFAAARGLDFDALLADARIERAALADADNEISLNAAASLLADAAHRANDPCFGLHWAEAFPKGGSGVLGYLLMNAKTIRDGVKMIARYTSLHLDPIEVTFTESEGFGRLEWTFPPGFTAPRMQYASFVMALAIVRLRKQIGPAWSPVGVELEHRELECTQAVLRVLGPNAKFNMPSNVLRLRESILNRTVDSADERLFMLIRQLGDRLLAERKTASDIVSMTRHAIVKSIERGDCTLEDIAGELDLSPRVLRTQLSAAGTNFETLLLDTRQGLAAIYLRDTDLPLTEIAYLLGFSELSAFTRAARGWFGVPPRVYRVELRQP